MILIRKTKNGPKKIENSDIRREALESMSRDLRRLAEVELEDSSEYRKRVLVPSGIFEIDQILMPVGGFLRGKVYEIFGEPGSWKTTLAMKVGGIFSKMFPSSPIGVIDAERAWGAAQGDWMRINGLDPDVLIRLPVFETDQVLRTIIEWAAAGVGMIIWDTVASTVSLSKTSSSFGQQRLPGSGPRALSEAMPKIREAVEENEVLLLLINQARKTFGFYSPYPFDSSGGYPTKHGMDARIAMSATKYIQNSKGVDIGREVRIEIRKSRLFPDGKSSGKKGGVCPNIRFYFDGSVGDRAEVIVDAAIELKIVSLKGGWYEWEGIRGHGINKFIQLLKSENAVDRLWEEVKLTPGELLEDLAEADERDIEDDNQGELW